MKLNEIVPWGRTLEEYKLMFDLSEADLSAKILFLAVAMVRLALMPK